PEVTRIRAQSANPRKVAPTPKRARHDAWPEGRLTPTCLSLVDDARWTSQVPSGFFRTNGLLPHLIGSLLPTDSLLPSVTDESSDSLLLTSYLNLHEQLHGRLL
ncbi:hypothetical protein THAOC_27236, partial [Thalassiosira oceanica]